MARGLWTGHYGANTVVEYWAKGAQFWFNSNCDYGHNGRRVLSWEDLRQYDSALHELLGRVYPATLHVPVDAFYKHGARTPNGE